MRHSLAIFLLATACACSAADDHFKPVSMFDGKKFGSWKVIEAFAGSGEVTVSDGAFDIGMGESLTGLAWTKTDPYPFPLDSYEISLEAMRVDGTDFFCGLTFPVRDLKTSATLIVGGWGGGLVGISSIEGLDASENSSGRFQSFKNKQWYKIRLQVQPTRIVIYIDDILTSDVTTEGQKLGMRFGDIEYSAPLGLTTFQSRAKIRNLSVRRLLDKEMDLSDY